MRPLLLLVVVFLCACQETEHCIAIGGEWKGIDGNVEYCWHKEKSQETGHAIFEGRDGEKFVAISEGEAGKINEMIEVNKSEDNVGMLESARPEKKDPIAELCKKLE